MQDNIEELEEQLKVLKFKIKQEKKKIPFSQTKFGSVYCRTLRSITKPFANLHSRVDTAIEDPKKLQNEKLLKEASDILSDLVQTKPEDKNAQVLTIQAAKFFINNENTENAQLKAVIEKFHPQIDRLRKGENSFKQAN